MAEAVKVKEKKRKTKKKEKAKPEITVDELVQDESEIDKSAQETQTQKQFVAVPEEASPVPDTTRTEGSGAERVESTQHSDTKDGGIGTSVDHIKLDSDQESSIQTGTHFSAEEQSGPSSDTVEHNPDQLSIQKEVTDLNKVQAEDTGLQTDKHLSDTELINKVETDHGSDKSEEHHKVETDLKIQKEKADSDTLDIKFSGEATAVKVDDPSSKSSAAETKVDDSETSRQLEDLASKLETVDIQNVTAIQADVGPGLYPDLTVEKHKMVEEMKSKDVVKHKVPVMRVAQTEEKPREKHQQQEQTRSYQPLTLEQLNSLYFNPQLTQNLQFIDAFIQNEMKKESHELYEIIQNYLRARKNLIQGQEAVEALERKYSQLQGDMWITNRHSISAKGNCGDGFKCTATHSYDMCTLNRTAVDEVNQTLGAIQKHLKEELSLHLYSAQLSRLQVESYIHNLYVTSPAMRDLPRNAPVYCCDRQGPDVTQQINRFRDCISVLFSFHRRPVTDDEFVKNLESWTERLVSSLLRVATFWDHLFVLNHIMRCPAGVGQWAGHLVQMPPIPTNMDSRPVMIGNPVLDHVMTYLATLLTPAVAREDFMCHMRQALTPTGPEQKDIPWILVDSDGEEDDDPQNAWVYLHENDLVALLRQFPMAGVIRHVLFIAEAPTGDNYVYDIKYTTEGAMFRLFAFCTCLVRMFGHGLHTYSKARFRQLNKRLGRMIRHTVQYVSDHWENFQSASQGVLPPEKLKQLQAEFDAFFMRATHCILTAPKLGSWQFIADMPFSNISKETMWQLLWLLHQGQRQPEDVSTIPSIEECRRFVQDPENKAQFCDVLQQVLESEALYLLNAMCNMTQACTAANTDIIEAIVLSVFEVGYVCTETRKLFSRILRELISSIIVHHPFVLSLITQKVHAVMEQLGVMSLYLYKGLPLHVWLPTDPDLVIVRQWLLTSDLGTTTNQLAQIILNGINWDTSEKGDRLMVPWRIHKQVAVLIVESYNKYVLGKNLGSAIMEGVKQMASVVHQQQTNEQEFNSWCWEMLLKLSLHRFSLPSVDQFLAATQADLPDLNKDDTLLPVAKGLKDKNPTACCVALLLTKHGHDLPTFMTEGVPLIQVLVDQGHYKAIICILSYTTQMFYDSHQYLLESEKFLSIVAAILHADETYLKMAKSFISYELAGPITSLLNCMIQSQISAAENVSQFKLIGVICLWTKLILKQPKWHLDRNCCYIVDMLVKAAFTCQPALQQVQLILQDEYQNFLKEEKHHGVVSSLVSWVTSGVTLPSFMERSSEPEFSWLSYVILDLEGQYEERSKLWSLIQEELIAHTKVGADQALKKATSKLKAEQAPAFQRLNIYRWSQQALDMPVDHPVLPLVWQRFFVLFLGRVITQTSMPQRASVGERFFTSISYSSVIKKMKKRLRETADHYVKLTTHSTEQDQDSEFTSETSDSGSGENLTKKQIHQKLARLFQTLQFWLEEPRLHDATLYLPSLPPQYQPDRLLQVFQNNKNPWMEYVCIEQVREELHKMAVEWKDSTEQYEQRRRTESLTDHRTDRQSATQRILARLKRHDVPAPPPALQPLKAPVPDISPVIMEDKVALLHLLESDLSIVTDYAGSFCARMAQLATVDYVYMDLVPKQFKNIPKQVTLVLECKATINPLHRCANPGSTSVRIEEKQNDIIVQRQIDENRADYKQLMIEGQLAPPQNVVIAAVHMENAITLLVKLYRSTSDHTRLSHLNDIACTLFFKLSQMINATVQEYPPTQQFFSSCVDILGQEFVQHDSTQTVSVLEQALERSEFAGLLAPHFNPSKCPNSFVSMYDVLVKTLQKGSPDLTFMLLTKFDISFWLTDHKPPQGDVRKFIEILGEALVSCGTDPDDRHKMAFDLYVGHVKILLRHRFPSLLNDILAMVLLGCSVQKLTVQCWELLVRECFQTRTQEEGTSSDNQSTALYTVLSTQQVSDILQWLGRYFLQLRLSNKDNATFGLYPKWKLYVACMSEFILRLMKCLIDKVLPTLDDASTGQGVDRLWQQAIEAFAPWIQPMISQDGLSSPWIDTDCEHATHMVKAFTNVVEYLFITTQRMRAHMYMDPLSQLWIYFTSVLSKLDIPNHVVTTYNREFVHLPWVQLQPNVQVLDAMGKLKETGNQLGFNLLADIVGVINWSALLQFYESYQPLDARAVLDGNLFLLLMQCYGEKKHIENPEMEKLLVQGESYRWQHLSPEAFRKCSSWFLNTCDSKCLLLGRSSPETLGLRLLKSASGFNVQSSAEWSDDLSVKRVSYVHAVAQLICQCTYQADCDLDSLSTVIINSLTEIETVEGAVVNSTNQQEETMDMVKEIVSLLNNCNPDGNSTTVVMTALIQWLQDSPQSILLLPMIRATTRSLADLHHMTRIVEECIQLHFTAGFQNSEGGGWSTVLAALQIPELNLTEYFKACLEEGSYLLLYCYCLQHLPMCQDLTEEQGTIELMIEWTEKAKPCAENECKLLLWWFKIFELLLRLLDYNKPQSLIITLINRFIRVVHVYGEDRTSSGLLGAIGLGKRSVLSEKFRFISKAVCAFCAAQIFREIKLRLVPSDPVPDFSHIKEVGALQSLRGNKKYHHIKKDIEDAYSFVSDRYKTFRNVLELMTVLTKRFYGDKPYLSAIRF